MPDHYTYLAVDFFCIIFPFLFSFIPRFNFIWEWRYFMLPCLLTGLFFIVWDILFTYLGVWGFNPSYVLGYFWYGLPLEEYLFFICIPYACVFTYHCIGLFFSFSAARHTHIIKWVFIGLLALTGVMFLPRLYTSVTFILLSLFIAFLSYKKVNYLPRFFFCYLLILIPFFISNGILTGSILQRTVVMYSRHHNLGIRMFTIPFEDAFYGMLLLMMNVAGYEYLKGRSLRRENQPVTDGK